MFLEAMNRKIWGMFHKGLSLSHYVDRHIYYKTQGDQSHPKKFIIPAEQLKFSIRPKKYVS